MHAKQHEQLKARRAGIKTLLHSERKRQHTKWFLKEYKCVPCLLETVETE